MQKLNSPVPRMELPKVPSCKPGVGQNIALHVSLAARNCTIQFFDLPIHSTSFFYALPTLTK